ncbi:WXG100 family type VII secretion target [Actinomyces ruminicola]|uniref:ESAT-6-like protein n=1 Tax=Actinomyces ruminicola TaxID=332524 RepID=A0A1H0BIN9_9ACTO|nr:WXG100 family type VII secretion target [Actinomyces ruminicola]SDN45518.1 WXG100 family type VII secretion target [Actinomyces ruminicola]
MSTNLAAGSGTLVNAANVVATHRGQQESILRNVENAVQELSPGWKGTGGAAFTSATNRWLEDARSIVRVLSSFESGLRNTDSAYQNTEEETASNVQNLAASSQGYHGMMA